MQRLSQEEGADLAGIKRVMELQNQVEALQLRVAEFQDGLEATQNALANAHSPRWRACAATRYRSAPSR